MRMKTKSQKKIMANIPILSLSLLFSHKCNTKREREREREVIGYKNWIIEGRRRK